MRGPPIPTLAVAFPDAFRRRPFWLAVAVVIVVVQLVVAIVAVWAAPAQTAALTMPGADTGSQPEINPIPPSDPDPTDRRQQALTESVRRYLADNPGFEATVAVQMGDTTLQYAEQERFETASAVKVEILVRWLLLRQGDELPAKELALADDMIRLSDNDATNDLCSIIAPETPSGAVPGGTDACVLDGLWGRDTTGAADQLQVLEAAFGEALLDEDSRVLVRELMGTVADDQVWGVSDAAHDDESVWLKNGWDERDGGWVVHSIGVIDADEPIRMAVLTGGQPDYFTGTEHAKALAQLAREAIDGDS